MIKESFLLGCLLLFCASVNAKPADEEVTYHERRFAGLHNFIRNPVEIIHQDNQGLMWFGSKSMLQRFDGMHLNTFLEKGDYSLLRLGSIQEVIGAGDDKFWINMTNGILNFDLRTGRYEVMVLGMQIEEVFGIKGRVVINKVCSDDRFLWLGTNQGLIKFDVGEEQITGIYQIIENHPGYINDFGEIIPVDTDLLAIGSKSSVYLFNKKTNEFSRDILGDGIRKKYRDLVLQNDEFGNLWIGYGGNLYSYSIASNSLKLEIGNFVETGMGQIPEGNIFNVDSTFWNSAIAIRKIIITEDQKLLISSRKHLFDYNPIGGSLSIVFSATGQSEKGGDQIIDVFSDNQENIWISTFSDGVVHLLKNKKSVRFIRKLIEGSDNILGTVYNIDVFHNGEIWAGRGKGKGLARIDLNKREIEEYPADGLQYEITRRMVMDPTGSIWAIADGGIIYSLDPVRKEYRYFHCPDTVSHREQWFFTMVMDGFGYLWAGGAGGGLVKLDPKTGKYQVFNTTYSNSNGFDLNPVWQVLKLGVNELLILTSTEAVRLKIIQEAGEDGSVYYSHRFSNYLGKKIEEIFPATRQRKAIMGFIDSKQNLWMGTDGAGFIKYCPGTDQFWHYNIKNGMPSNAIKSILEDNFGYIWIATDMGFSRLDPVEEVIDNVFYWSDSDFPHKQVDWWDGHRDNQGILYYGILEDPMIIDPADFLNCENDKKKIVFSDLRINNLPQRPWIDQTIPFLVSNQPDIHLDHTHHILTLNYAVLDYSDPDKYKYRYKLEGFDQDWIETDHNTTLTYSNLPPGNYRLIVNFSDSYQFDEQNIASLNVFKAPPPWNTWWARLGYIIIFCSLGYLLITLMIKRHKTQKKLEKEHLELEKVKEIDEAKTRFFTEISHEIRTPLSLILQPVESLIRGEARGDESVFYHVIRRNALRLSDLLNQMLDLSRLRSGKLTVRAVQQNIVDFVRLRLANFESMATSQGLTLEFESQFKDIMVYFDPDKIEKVINNLLSNAIKFTPAGGRIRVRVRREGKPHIPGKGIAVITVMDSGIGIAEDQREKIFERFYRVRDDYEYEGVGIGLSLARELVELHQGTIRVESKPGEGSVFDVVLPLGKSHFTGDQLTGEIQEELIHKSSDKAQNIEVAGKGVRIPENKEKRIILFIEDNEDMQEYIKHALELEYTFIGTRNGNEGLEAARKFIPDLIISDIMMPGLDGREVCRRIKEDRQIRHIPVILLTARARKEDRVEGLGTGADDYIVKPFDIRELKYRIRNQLSQLERLRERYIKAFLLNDPHIAITSRDDAFLSNLIEVVNNNLENPSFSVSELSHELGVSRSLLYRKLIALTGKQPNEFIRVIRLKKAAELLAADSGNVSEIAYAVGFNNISYFSRCFHAMYQVAPSEFLKHGSGKNRDWVEK